MSTIASWVRINSASCLAISTPKASSPRKMFPMQATRILPLTGHLMVQLDRLQFFGREKEPVPRLPQHSQIAAGIIVEHDRDVDVVIEVALNRLDDCGPAL